MKEREKSNVDYSSKAKGYNFHYFVPSTGTVQLRSRCTKFSIIYSTKFSTQVRATPRLVSAGRIHAGVFVDLKKKKKYGTRVPGSRVPRYGRVHRCTAADLDLLRNNSSTVYSY